MNKAVVLTLTMVLAIFMPELVYVSAQTPEPARIIETGPVGQVRWSPTDDILATVGRSSEYRENGYVISLWKSTGELIKTLGGENHSLRAIEWSPNGEMIVALDSNYRLQLWQVDTGETLFSFLLDKAFTGRQQYVFFLTSLSWSPDSTHLAIGNDASLSIVDIATLEGMTIQDETGYRYVVGVAWSPNGQKLAQLGEFGELKIFDTANSELLITSPGLGYSPIDINGTDSQRLAWSPDGNLIANIGEYIDRTPPDVVIRRVATIRDAQTGEIITHLEGHEARVTSVTWSPDGSKIASTSEDATIIIWDANTFKQIVRLKGHTDVVSSASWSPDGKYLASGSYDGKVRIWEIPE